MENNRFEDAFRNAFEGAEVSPSAAVWMNIEADLEKTSGGKMKRNLLLFQLLAAASVAFAFGVMALYYADQPVPKNDFSNEPLSKREAAPLRDSAGEAAAQKMMSAEVVKKHDQEKSSRHKVKRFNKNEIEHDAAAGQALAAQREGSSIEYKIARTDLSAFARTKKPVLVLPGLEEPVEPDAGMVLLARLKDQEKRYQDEENKTASRENVWASVGFGAGSYKPNRQLYLANAASSSQSTGESYSVGVQVAGKLSKRFIVQGGVSYLTQNANFISTASNHQNNAPQSDTHQSATLSEFVRPANFNSYQGVSPYVVNSSMQFVSIPVQAGYLVVDRAFGVQLNGGISTDLFISNTLLPENDDYEKITQAAGKESPYRTVNFSGLLGTELSYKIAGQYRISLNPGLRYSLNSIYKQEVAAELTPVTFDVSLRFRYIFK
jgi:hypothetical protein